MNNDDVTLTRELIERAFDEMGQMARDAEVTVEIAVYGGSCLVLCTEARAVTRDVDAVFLSNRDIGYELADATGRHLGLPDRWLNQAVKSLAPPKGNPEPSLFEFGEYPRGGGVPGLRVFVPTPEYILAMKILSYRGEDIVGAKRDADDIHDLMKITGLRNSDDLVSLIKKCYPSIPGIMDRLATKVEDIVSNHDPEANAPSWNAGRGDPTL